MPLKNKDKKENNISELLLSATSLLKKQQIKEADFEAQTLLARALRKDRVFVIAHPEYLVSKQAENSFLKLIKSRLQGWSLAVILGSKNFYTSELLVNKDVLVPRPETEIMVEAILQEIKDGDTIIDIGTGSGAIIISVAKERLEKPNHFYASDKSVKALKVARYNIKNNNLPIKLLTGDLLQPYLPIFKKQPPVKLIIAANLPYLTPAQMKEPSIKKEPASALLSGADGLWHYQRLFTQLDNFLRSINYSINASLYCEINPEQKNEIKKKALAKFPKAKVNFLTDLKNDIRFCVISISNHSSR
ncbi:MAG: peptide chain release factor N(5)-glutamine methyltransferase [Patescibacteria group bacterium]